MNYVNHLLHQIKDDTYECVNCKIIWTYLSEQDRNMLQSNQGCLGRKEQWHTCKFSGAWCIGQEGYETCEVLQSSLVVLGSEFAADQNNTSNSLEN